MRLIIFGRQMSLFPAPRATKSDGCRCSYNPTPVLFGKDPVPVPNLPLRRQVRTNTRSKLRSLIGTSRYGGRRGCRSNDSAELHRFEKEGDRGERRRGKERLRVKSETSQGSRKPRNLRWDDDNGRKANERIKASRNKTSMIDRVITMKTLHVEWNERMKMFL